MRLLEHAVLKHRYPDASQGADRLHDLESDPAFKQIITYTTVQYGSELFTYSRDRSGGESRLHGKRSIGVGGHVDEGVDVFNDDFRYTDRVQRLKVRLLQGAAREISEEIGLMVGLERLSIKGWINDDSQPVGQVHLGVHIAVDLGGKPDFTCETHLADPRWLDFDQVYRDRSDYETWSQLVIGNLAFA